MNDLTTKIESVQNLMDEKKYEQAIELLESLDTDNHCDTIDYYLGLNYCKIKDYDTGAEHFRHSASVGDSEFACRSYNNLASLYKRKKGTENYRIAFGYLENALQIAENLNLQQEKEEIYERIARYIIDLNMFGEFKEEYLGVDWKRFRTDLPVVELPKKKHERTSLIYLIVAFIYWKREQNFAKTKEYLIKSKDSFGENIPMLEFIFNFQQEMIGYAQSVSEKARLQEETKQAKQDLARLYEVGKAITAELDLDKLLTLIVDNVIEIAEAERGFLMLEDGSGIPEFRIARDNQHRTLTEEKFTISRTIYRNVIETGEPLLLEDIESDKDFESVSSVTALSLKSALCAPLKAENRLLGVIYVDNSIAKGNFGERELELLTTLSTQAAIAIQNASLYRSLEEKKKYLEDLLLSTKEMAKADSPLVAISIFVDHILKIVHPFRHATPQLYLFQNESVTYYEWQDEGFEFGEIETELPDIKNLDELSLEDGILSAPIWQGENKFGIILFKGLPKRDIRTEDKYFISGLLNSLAFVLENLKRERQKKLALIGQMAAGIIHDLKTPLTVIQGYAQLMLDCGIKMEMSEKEVSLKFITDQANTMVRMVNDILDFARGSIELNIEQYLIKAYVQSLMESIKPLLEDKNIQLDLQFDYKGEVRLDIKRFQRVLLNIMKNAIEAIDVGDKIRIHVWKEDNTLFIAIVNNGPKIPPEIQKTLFNPFVTHGKIGGTGLGMAIVKKIVEEHGGEITFTSDETETKFVITLPQ